MHKVISSVFGIGYIGKGGGTVAAIAACIAWYFLHAGGYTVMQQVIISIVICLLGIWSGNVVEKDWGKDNKKVVIDEVAGMCIALIAVPGSYLGILAALVLFRFFDIAKPLFIRSTEKLPGGWGVMMDDIVAGIYANLILQFFIYLKWL
ncbi:phosphatidylglycerophosphatase A family protein [Taibaiella soli]|uniref:Phosphatidylglycerophosphatase A n=1 Tax=Taibaiella soli TaxID=1649169 RepID=A0A2W2B0Z5_9BACT|nr:phosphatidylglycerophosphatase A [Taibaiella soli]PZF73914.1 phosphatidylglycerophosphatase A [Taibaiella soli]